MKVNAAQLKGIKLSSDKTETNDRMHFDISEMDISDNILKIKYIPSRGRKYTEITKDRYRKSGEWLARAGVVLTWKAIQSLFGPKEESMKINHLSEASVADAAGLANVIYGVKAINRRTAKMANPTRDLDNMITTLKNMGYTRIVNADGVKMKKAGSPTVYYDYEDDARTQILIQVEAQQMKTFEQFIASEAKFDNAIDYVDNLANTKNSGCDMYLDNNQKQKLFDLFKAGKNIQIWKGSKQYAAVKKSTLPVHGFTEFYTASNPGSWEIIYYK